MAKRRKGSGPKSDDGARGVISVRLGPEHMQLLEHVAHLTGVPVQIVSTVILAMGLLREVNNLRAAGQLPLRPLAQSRRNTPWRTKIQNRKLVASRR